MHSRVLQGTDFSIRSAGTNVSHATFFERFAMTDRLALLTPYGWDGLGAAALLLAFVTAYYDRWREAGGESTSYPEFFTFQSRLPCADYCMLDIWPYHRNLYCAEATEAWSRIAARRVDILLMPDTCGSPASLPGVRECYVYAAEGSMDDSNLEVRLASKLVGEYMLDVIDSLPADVAADARERWQAQLANAELVQQFKKTGGSW